MYSLRLLFGRLVLLLLASAAGRCLTRSLLMDDEFGVELFLIPLEPSEVRVFELVGSLSMLNRQ
jgi:hypothetical protein